MPSSPSFLLQPSAAALLVALLSFSAAAQQSAGAADGTLGEVKVLGTAEEELRQSLGASTITAEDIERRPPANDIAELIRTQPGVNLTGASSSGSYGNNRQIDLRGMGPENTLILIDGKPVQSRNAVQMRRSGERNTRGDTNWVPAESIERIEVIRGPAAARYGSGAAGGVVNIITKKPTGALTGSITAYTLLPEDSKEGASRRLGFNFAGPVARDLSFRLYGNVAKTEADATDINAAASGMAVGPAGREGVRNRDINGLLRWDLNPDHVLEFEAGFSRQGNIYTNERFLQADSTPLMSQLAAQGAETNSTLRQTASVTHRGKWGSFGNSRVLFQYENNRRTHILENPAGGPEGSFVDPLTWTRSELQNYFANGELYTPLRLGGLQQMLTTGVEWRLEKLDDPGSMNQTSASGGGVPGVAAARSGKTDAQTFAFYLEDNISVATPFILTPGLRFDHHDQFGHNWSPSLNATYELSPEFTLKGGVARAFKAPNLYQANPDYLYYTRGNGCSFLPAAQRAGGCYIQGNADLKPETSINKEIGVAWNNQRGWTASLTYFRNDYKNKINADMWDQAGAASGSGATLSRVYRWKNAEKAIVQGVEGNFNIPLAGVAGNRLKLLNNFTYMVENEDKTTGQQLSIIPKYTVNSTLDWQATAQLSAQATATFYGRQKPRTLTALGSAATGAALEERGAYALVGLSGTYRFSKSYRTTFGVLNLFDKRLYRESIQGQAGANTYNEPGRAFYVSFTGSF